MSEDYIAVKNELARLETALLNSCGPERKKLGKEKLKLQNKLKFMKDVGLRPASDWGAQERVDDRRRGRMDFVDAQTPAIRELIHHYGLAIVKNFLDVGVKNPRHIRHIVERILDEYSPTRGSYSLQGQSASENRANMNSGWRQPNG